QRVKYHKIAIMIYDTAAALLLTAVLSCLYPLPFWAYAVMGTILSVMLIYLSGAVRKDESAVAHMLDRRFPELEHSSVLLLKPTPSLGVDRKSTRLNSSHVKISYAVFCLKKKS